MSQQALRSTPYPAAEGIIEEILEETGLRPGGQTGSPVKNDLSRWGAILPQLNQRGFSMITSQEAIARAGKESIEALTKSSAAITEGLREINQHMIAVAQKSVTAQSMATKEALDIKSPGDWADMHSRWAVEWMTSTISHLTHLSQLSTKAMHQAYAPIQAHCDATFRKMGGSSS